MQKTFASPSRKEVEKDKKDGYYKCECQISDFRATTIANFLWPLQTMPGVRLENFLQGNFPVFCQRSSMLLEDFYENCLGRLWKSKSSSVLSLITNAHRPFMLYSYYHATSWLSLAWDRCLKFVYVTPFIYKKHFKNSIGIKRLE